MKHEQEVRIAFAVLLVLLTLQGTAAYEENIREGIFLVRPDNTYIVDTAIPTYLENEDLVFFACLETKDTPIRLSFICQDTNEFEDIAVRKWGPQNCYIGSTNLERFDCTRGIVQADYIQGGENLKLSQEIRINKFSNTLNRIIETQFADGGWETPLDTAYGLFAISHFPDIFPERINKALEYLKNSRDEQRKCWPAGNCITSTTATILFLLDKAGYSGLRIQHDGYIYLQDKQEYLGSGTTWTVSMTDHPLNVNNTINTSCVFEYAEDLSVHILDRHPRTRTITITPAYNNHIGAACTENIIVTLRNEHEEQMLTYQGDNFSYTIPPPCWTLNDEHITCDVRTTAFAVNTRISSTHKSPAGSWLSALLVSDRIAGKHVEENWTVMNDALYLHSQQNSDIITALLYYQNNTGGWHMQRDYYDKTYFQLSDAEYRKLRAEVTDQVSKDIVATGYAVMALLARGWTRDREVILDAERWVSLHEDVTGLNYTDEDLTREQDIIAYRTNKSLILNDTKRNAMAFYVLTHNARPVLLARPRILVMNRETIELDIVNPTIFELDALQYELSDNLREYLSIEEKDFVGAYSFRRVTLTLRKEPAGSEIGYLRIKEQENEYFKLPIIVETRPQLNITLPEQLTVFGGTTVLPFSVTKSEHSFSCNLEWTTQGISSGGRFDLETATETYNFPVRFAVLETENTVYEGVITCTAERVTFVIPIATNIIRFSNRPLQVRPEILTINDETPGGTSPITVRNMLDQAIEVAISVAIPDPYVNLGDTYISLYPGETRNISVEIIPPAGENYTTSNSIIFSTFNVEERVLLDVELMVASRALQARTVIIALVVLVLTLSILGFFGWRNRDALMEWYQHTFRKERVREKVFREVAEIERQEMHEAIRNMVRLLKLQGIKDVEVRTRLLNDGYTPEDIDTALSGEDTTQKPQKGNNA